MAITIKDIARLAGVSRGTVDRVINGRGKVSEKNRKKIQKIIKEHGYVKNILASKLASQANYRIAIVLPDPQKDPFWLSPLKGIQRVEDFFSNYGFKLDYFFFNLTNLNDYIQKLNDAILSKPNAILCAPVFYQESIRFMQIAQQNKIPFICINSEIKHDDILCYVGQNSYQCGTIAARLFSLTNKIHEKIATITLGHHFNNASHIVSKLNGLRHYNNNFPFTKEIIDLGCEDFNHQDTFNDFCLNIYKDHPDIEGFFVTNSRAYIFLDQLEKLGIDFNKQTFIGFDLLDQNLDYLNKGAINFLLNQNPIKQGYLGMMNIFNYFIYKKEINRYQFLPIDIIIKENYKNHLEQESYDLELVI